MAEEPDQIHWVGLPWSIDPPLLNSACPWATTLEDLADLYKCPHTGAITIRTSLYDGFPHDNKTHQYTFFDPASGLPSPNGSSSLNSLGYSPYPFSYYFSLLQDVASGKYKSEGFTTRISKPIIVSVTGSPEDIGKFYQELGRFQAVYRNTLKLFMEINLSCPNIAGKDPPAYDMDALREYLHPLMTSITIIRRECTLDLPGGRIHVGIKIPPYTYPGQLGKLVELLEEFDNDKLYAATRCPITFITATNTLGNSFVFADPSSEKGTAALNSSDGSGIGGMAGAAIHALSLGNVKRLKELLSKSRYESVRAVKVIGVGGVADRAGFERMKSVGADAVGLATALGREGLGVFEKILS